MNFTKDSVRVMRDIFNGMQSIGENNRSIRLFYSRKGTPSLQFKDSISNNPKMVAIFQGVDELISENLILTSNLKLAFQMMSRHETNEPLLNNIENLEKEIDYNARHNNQDIKIKQVKSRKPKKDQDNKYQREKMKKNRDELFHSLYNEDAHPFDESDPNDHNQSCINPFFGGDIIPDDELPF